MIAFHITKGSIDTLTVAQAMTLEALAFGEQPRLSAQIDLLAHFMVDAEQAPILSDAARAALGVLSISELSEVARAFAAAWKDYSLPPQSGPR